MVNFSENRKSEVEKYNMVYSPVSQENFTVPNLITLVRILLTPIFIIFLIQGRYDQALWIFLLAGISDLADGLVARTWQQRSRLGSYLDPLADKLLMAASFVTLSIYRQIPSWLTVIVLSRDVIMALGVLLFRLADHPLVIKPSLMGKWTTTLQIATVLLVLLGKLWAIPPAVLTGCFWITGGLTAASGIHYVYGGLRQANLFPGNSRGAGPHG